MIQYHVTSLDLSKQLYEAGIKIKSEFWWIGIKGENAELAKKGDDPHADFILGNKRKLKKFVPDGFCYPAPLSSELWEILKKFEKENYDQVPSWDTYHKKWYFQAGYDMGDITEWLEVDTEADARAKMLLYLKEKGLLL